MTFGYLSCLQINTVFHEVAPTTPKGILTNTSFAYRITESYETNGDPESIKQTSTANCCSDHFDLELDLDRYTSSIGNAKLEKDSIPSPSGMHENIIERNAEIMKTLDIFKGNDLTPENLYVREVVYIEENQNDRFLEEGLESEDIMLIEPDTEAKNEPTKDVSVMQPNRSPMSRPTSIQNQIVPYRSKEPNEFSALKPLKPSILRHRKQMISVEKLGSGKRKSVPMPIPVQIPEKNVLPKPNLRIGKPVTMKLQVMPNVVNKMKYSNYDEFKKFLNHKNLESTGSKSQDDDDDDCILVEEQNVLNNERTATNLNPSMKVLTSLPPSISIKYSKCAKPVQYSNGGTFSLAEASKPVPSQVPLNSANALVPVGPKLNRARTEEVTNNMPTVPDGGVFQLIKLMIAENQMLLANKKGNCVKIARTKPNQFRIFDNIYYYRTNNSFAKNYFFMNITRNAVHSEEIIQRNYGIYWGHPRRSCVGIVETKGILDDNTKDFVFQQVKKSLFNENGPQNLKLVNVSQPNQKHLISREKTVPVKIIKMPTKELEYDNNGMVQSNTANKQVYDPKPSTTKRRSKEIVSDVTSIAPVTKKLAPPVQPSRQRRSKAITKPNELIRLSNYLTPTIRKLINKLKYFELNDTVYTVNISEDRLAKTNPFNIMFTENKQQSGCRPVSKQLYVAKLVSYLFKAVHPFMNNPSNMLIPILPPPPDIISIISPESMESLLITESRSTYMTENSQHANSNKNKVRHECVICSQVFERKYQLMRHRFVQHNIDQMNSTATSTKSITDRVPNIIRKFMKIPMESTPKTQISELQSKTKISELQSKTHISELQSKTHINTELMEETSDGSLLLPQFEVPIKESFKDDATGFTLVKCKQEPEAYFEIIEPPFSTDDKVPLKKPKQKTRKRKLSNKVGGFEEIEETDSAPECFNNETGGSKRRRKKLSGKRTNVKEFKDLVKEVKEVRKSQKKSVRELLKAKKWFQ